MVRTQIQLPDDLYRRLKALAADKEWTLAEAVRRSLEAFLDSYPTHPIPPDEWELPEPLPLGEFLAPVEEWRDLANQREP